MAKSEITCAWCAQIALKENGAIERARKQGAPLYCSKQCFGLARRLHKTSAQKREEKRLYDKEYRRKNRELLKAKKAAWFRQTYDPAKAAIERKKRMPRHVEYCRRPEYKAWKRDYDRTYRAKRNFGEFWESHLLMLDIEHEALARASRYEIALGNGLLSKSQKRKREHERAYR